MIASFHKFCVLIKQVDEDNQPHSPSLRHTRYSYVRANVTWDSVRSLHFVLKQIPGAQNCIPTKNANLVRPIYFSVFQVWQHCPMKDVCLRMGTLPLGREMAEAQGAYQLLCFKVRYRASLKYIAQDSKFNRSHFSTFAVATLKSSVYLAYLSQERRNPPICYERSLGKNATILHVETRS